MSVSIAWHNKWHKLWFCTVKMAKIWKIEFHNGICKFIVSRFHLFSSLQALWIKCTQLYLIITHYIVCQMGTLGHYSHSNFHSICLYFHYINTSYGWMYLKKCTLTHIMKKDAFNISRTENKMIVYRKRFNVVNRTF